MKGVQGVMEGVQLSNANAFLSHLTEQPKRCSLGGGWVLFKRTCHIALQEACFMRCRRGRAAAVNINKSRAQPGNEAENGRYGAVKGRYRAIICPIRQGLLPGDAGR